MVLEQPKKDIINSSEFRSFFLLKFTKALIKESQAEEIMELENTLKEEERGVEELELPEKINLPQKTAIAQNQRTHTRLRIRPSGPVRIPEPRLPPRLQYLRPTPTKMQIDLGELNPLISNSMIDSIECNGPNTNVLARGRTGAKKTGIVLSDKEVDDVIKKFSEQSKIPIEEGIHKIVHGKLILSAIVSKTIGSKFIIKKMAFKPQAPQGMMPGPPRRF